MYVFKGFVEQIMRFLLSLPLDTLSVVGSLNNDRH